MASLDCAASCVWPPDKPPNWWGGWGRPGKFCKREAAARARAGRLIHLTRSSASPTRPARCLMAKARAQANETKLPAAARSEHLLMANH